MSEERAALDGLLTHPGWLLFKQEAKKRWGPEGYARELKKAVQHAIETNQSAEAAIKAVDFANDEINSLLTWPTVRAASVKERDELELRGPLVSRRGPNL